MTLESNDPALVVDEPTGGGGVGAGATPPELATPDPAPPVPPSPSHWVREGIIVVVVAVLVAVLLRAFVVQTFYIPSGSMLPTLQIGDRILVNKLSYHLHGVDRGDIVVFSRPPAENCGGPPVNDLVKRVIGLPGNIMSVSGGYVYVDGRRLDELGCPLRTGGHDAGAAHHPLQPGHALPGAGRRLLRDGRQPQGLLRQPLLGPHCEVAHRGQGRSPCLAHFVRPLLLIARF